MLNEFQARELRRNLHKSANLEGELPESIELKPSKKGLERIQALKPITKED